MTPSLPRAPQVERIYIQFADNGNIRKWQRGPFDGGAEYVAASPSSEAAGWRPIETAPHGVEVLLATPPFRCMGEQARWEMRVGCASWGERIGGFSNRSQDAYATHWMPLPAAPVSHGGVE